MPVVYPVLVIWLPPALFFLRIYLKWTTDISLTTVNVIQKSLLFSCNYQMEIFLFARQKNKSDQRAKGGGEVRSQHSKRAVAWHKLWAPHDARETDYGFQKGSNQQTQSWLNVSKCLSDAAIRWQLGNHDDTSVKENKSTTKEMSEQRSAQVVDPHTCRAWRGCRGSDQDWETDDEERAEFSTFQTVVTGLLGWVTFDPNRSHVMGARAKNKW